MAKRTRRCLVCKADIGTRGNKSVRCRPCQVAYRQQRAKVDVHRAPCLDDDGSCTPTRRIRGRCSRHYYTARRDNGWKIPQQPRTCPTCDKIFTPVRSDAICCSSECNWRRQDALRRVDHPERLCGTCRQMFKPKRYDQSVCSIECIPDRARRATARWIANNRPIVVDHWHRRRKTERDNQDSVRITPRDWSRLVNRFDGRCAYCSTRTRRLTIDHIIPVSRGGRHSIGNALPACLSCNSSKGALLLIQFKVRRGMIHLRDRVPVEVPTFLGGSDVFAGVRYGQLALPLGVGG